MGGRGCAAPSGISSWGWRKAPAAAYKMHIFNKAPFSVKKLTGKEKQEFRLLSHLFCAYLVNFSRQIQGPFWRVPWKGWDCIWSRGSPQSLPPAISLTNQLSQDPQPCAAHSVIVRDCSSLDSNIYLQGMSISAWDESNFGKCHCFCQG